VIHTIFLRTFDPELHNWDGLLVDAHVTPMEYEITNNLAAESEGSTPLVTKYTAAHDPKAVLSTFCP
jgi:hypothetical protein